MFGKWVRWGLKVWITSMVGTLSEAIFHKNAWTFEDTRGNRIVLWGKGGSAGTGHKKEKKED